MTQNYCKERKKPVGLRKKIISEGTEVGKKALLRLVWLKNSFEFELFPSGI